MINLTDICSLTDFQKQTKKHLRRLKRTGKPEVLTLNGRAEVVVQSAKGYEELMEKADLNDSVRILAKRLSGDSERDVPAKRVLSEIRQKLGLGESH